ncbi:MAG: electron transfer flavoprotein subunit alpha/FixB family protein [Bacteroidales bacterium]
MHNIFVYCEIDEGQVADVSLELLTKGRKLANELDCKLEAAVMGHNLKGIEKSIYPYGVDILHIADDKRLAPYTTLPHAHLVVNLFQKIKPEVALFGATSVGRDLAPRVASKMKCGLTADCTSLVFGDHKDNKSGKEYKNLLYQIRPAFGGNIIATIINPETRPQMATVREGVMKREISDKAHSGSLKVIKVEELLTDDLFPVRILERHMEKKKINIKASPIIISGGYGVGSRENFEMLYELAEVLGGEVGASRAAVDAGFADHERQVGQTGVTVRPKLYIACGISGAVQHTAGMSDSAKIIAINNDPKAPINEIADYSIIGNIEDIIPKMIKFYKQNTK